MPPKRVATKPASPSSPPLANALLLGSALAYGLWNLVHRGRVSWPPHDLLADAYTLAGCLALIGPLVLARRDADGGGVGDLLWMTGGLLVWVYDLAALARGDLRSASWVTPVGAQPMGLTMLAVLLAGWRTGGGAGRDWSWTGIIGWSLGLFWAGLALVSLVPGRPVGLLTR